MNPARTAFEIWKSYRKTANEFCLHYTGFAGYGSSLARFSEKVFFFPWHNFPEFPIIFSLIVSWIAARKSNTTIACCAWAAFIFTLGLPLQSAIIYVADAMEIQRHSLAVTITLRLLFFISIFIFIDLFNRTTTHKE